jgi:hypothetical protein
MATKARCVTANVVPSSPIFVALLKEARSSSEMLVLTRATWRNVPEEAILHSQRRGNLKSFIALTGLALQRRRNVSPVKYELGFRIPEDDILHSHRRENLKSYIINTWLITVTERSKVWSVLSSSTSEIMGSNPIRRMDVFWGYCVFVLSCV